MKKLKICCFILLSLLISCDNHNKKNYEIETTSEAIDSIKIQNRDGFYHYSIWWAFVNKVFEGDINAAHLKTKGDIGLGSYNQLDGELIMLDGILYQAKEDGTVLEPKDDIKIAYANAAFFDTEYEFDLKYVENYETLREAIDAELPSKNYFYAFKIHGQFKQMTCGGLHKQEKPFVKGLDTLIPNRPIFQRQDFTGTMVGFYCPDFIGNINVSGYHLHFISDDKKFAGHVMEFQADSLKVEFDQINKYQFVLPKTENFENVGFDKEFQYKKN